MAHPNIGGAREMVDLNDEPPAGAPAAAALARIRIGAQSD